MPAAAPSSTSTIKTDTLPQNSIAEDIEEITERIESARADITAGYDNWRDIGFALSDALGDNGRDIFHRVSRFNESYNENECDASMTDALDPTALELPSNLSSKRQKMPESTSPHHVHGNPQHLQYPRNPQMQKLRILLKLRISLTRWRTKNKCLLSPRTSADTSLTFWSALQRQANQMQIATSFYSVH